MKEIFITLEWNERVFEILEAKIMAGKMRTSRESVDLWQIFVLSQVRLCQNISNDELHHIANNDHLVRQIIGVERGVDYECHKFDYQNIVEIMKHYWQDHQGS